MLRATQAEARRHNKTMEAGPPDPEHDRTSGGVGIIAQNPLTPIPILNPSKAYEDAVATGRCVIYNFDLFFFSYNIKTQINNLNLFSSSVNRKPFDILKLHGHSFFALILLQALIDGDKGNIGLRPPDVDILHAAVGSVI
jgi:hypothetical protein